MKKEYELSLENESQALLFPSIKFVTEKIFGAFFREKKDNKKRKRKKKMK